MLLKTTSETLKRNGSVKADLCLPRSAESMRLNVMLVINSSRQNELYQTVFVIVTV